MLIKVIRVIRPVIASLLLVAAVQAQLIDNANVSIIDSYTAYPGYDVDFAIDTGPDAILSDYASQGGGIDTYIDFDLGQAYTLSEIVFTDRVTSGGPNHAWIGGLFDIVYSFNYTLSVDDNFDNGNGQTDDIIVEVEAEIPLGQVPDESEIAQFQTSALMPDLAVRYVRWQIVDTPGANPGANNFDFIAAGGGVLGDFNGNGDLDADDIDALSAAVRANSTDLKFDVNSDNAVTDSDRTTWVETLKKTYFGDANLDGEFNSGDFVAVFTVGKYETGTAALWAEGDWNGDARFDSSDFVTAFQAGGYETGPRAAVSAVPEPAAMALLLTGLLAIVSRRRAWIS